MNNIFKSNSTERKKLITLQKIRLLHMRTLMTHKCLHILDLTFNFKF